MKYMSEMANNKADTIIKCNRSGRIFAKHFVKCLNDISHIDIDLLHHHCKEMQAWWNDVREDKLKSNNKVLTNTKLIDWFFSGGMVYEDFMSSSQALEYEKFIKALLKDRSQDIYELMCELFVR